MNPAPSSPLALAAAAPAPATPLAVAGAADAAAPSATVAEPPAPSGVPPWPPVAASPTGAPAPGSTATAFAAPSAPATSVVGPVLAGLLLAALAVVALLAARRRRRAPRLVEILESAHLGPKRSLVVARMGGDLLLLGSSEGGIALLATRPVLAEVPAAGVAPAEAGERGAPATAVAAAAPAVPLLASVDAAPEAGAPGALRAFGSDLLARLAAARQRAPAPARPFETLLAESVEDAELRRKLAAGQVGSVR